MISDPFKVLGVRDDCSDADLKKAYREKSKKWHPDQNPGKEEYAEKRFQEVQEAYRQIQDARQRGTSAYGSPRGAGYGGGNGQQGSYQQGQYQQNQYQQGPYQQNQYQQSQNQ
jgi:molecular chaperone DnaJ